MFIKGYSMAFWPTVDRHVRLETWEDFVLSLVLWHLDSSTADVLRRESSFYQGRKSIAVV